MYVLLPCFHSCYCDLNNVWFVTFRDGNSKFYRCLSLLNILNCRKGFAIFHDNISIALAQPELLHVCCQISALFFQFLSHRLSIKETVPFATMAPRLTSADHLESCIWAIVVALFFHCSVVSFWKYFKKKIFYSKCQWLIYFNKSGSPHYLKTLPILTQPMKFLGFWGFVLFVCIFKCTKMSWNMSFGSHCTVTVTSL